MHKEFLEQAVKKMQEDLFNVVRSAEWNGKQYHNGQTAKTGYIRSKGFINPINDVLKKSLNLLDSNLEFRPTFGSNNTVGEEEVTGFMKKKNKICQLE